MFWSVRQSRGSHRNARESATIAAMHCQLGVLGYNHQAAHHVQLKLISGQKHQLTTYTSFDAAVAAALS